eukprot:6476231-Amphidinium_carterae.1
MPLEPGWLEPMRVGDAMAVGVTAGRKDLGLLRSTYLLLQSCTHPSMRLVVAGKFIVDEISGSSSTKIVDNCRTGTIDCNPQRAIRN